MEDLKEKADQYKDQLMSKSLHQLIKIVFFLPLVNHTVIQ